jgi:hypothetical protein
VPLIKRLARPVGRMKIPYYNPFDVYDPVLVDTLREHPEILKAQERRQKGVTGNARAAANTRKSRCAEHLAVQRPELRELYEELVEKHWNPRTEAELKSDRLYTEFPAMLWDALAPFEEDADEAREIICNILWAMPKEHTWKVTEDGGQDTPLAWSIWNERLAVEGHEKHYRDVFAASIRHRWFRKSEIPKWRGRELALQRLSQISSRQWPDTAFNA